MTNSLLISRKYLFAFLSTWLSWRLHLALDSQILMFINSNANILLLKTQMWTVLNFECQRKDYYWICIVHLGKTNDETNQHRIWPIVCHVIIGKYFMCAIIARTPIMQRKLRKANWGDVQLAWILTHQNVG